MELETLIAIASLAEKKHVRIELLPTGFGITAKTIVKGRGMIKVTQMIPYIETAEIGVFEAAIDSAIAKLQVP